MGFWKRLFGEDKSKNNSVSVSVTTEINDIVSAQMVESALETISYEGESVEQFYERMSKALINTHGPLVSVDYISHFPKFEIYFTYKDGMRIYSGQRTGHYDIHFLTLGYVGEGPRYAQHFLSAAGFDLTSEQIESIEPGDSILLKNKKAVIQKKKDKVKKDASGEVKFLREISGESFGATATYVLYEGPHKAAAIAFLEKQDITAQSYFIGVKTPEGTFCKDRMGLFDAPTPNWPND